MRVCVDSDSCALLCFSSQLDHSFVNLHRYRISTELFPFKRANRRRNRCGRRCPYAVYLCSAHVAQPSDAHDPRMGELLDAEVRLGLPRFVANATSNSWRRKVGVVFTTVHGFRYVCDGYCVVCVLCVVCVCVWLCVAVYGCVWLCVAVRLNV